jgi:hypothetical protein
VRRIGAHRAGGGGDMRGVKVDGALPRAAADAAAAVEGMVAAAAMGSPARGRRRTAQNGESPRRKAIDSSERREPEWG